MEYLFTIVLYKVAKIQEREVKEKLFNPGKKSNISYFLGRHEPLLKVQRTPRNTEITLKSNYLARLIPSNGKGNSIFNLELMSFLATPLLSKPRLRQARMQTKHWKDHWRAFSSSARSIHLPHLSDVSPKHSEQFCMIL